MTGVVRLDDFQSIDNNGDSSAERQPGDGPLEPPNWTLPQPNTQGYTDNGLTMAPGFVDFEREKGMWDCDPEKMYPMNAGACEFTEAEAKQFGLEGLIDMLEKHRGDRTPIVSHSHLDVELLKKRVMEL